ncbi:unnamed protein product [Callosobruchus maculatus]|uniref:Uncharacterized protein n=1 Tax=Callosobruchus maculatus TaxID=64391 RepID=A0A653CCC8_CALMS|nr:unnamed protein product [Callosobruchus maculatus]
MAARHRASRQHTREATLRERSTGAASTSTGSRREPDSISGNLTHCGTALLWGPQCCQGSLQEETCSRKCHRTNDGCLKPQYHQTVQLYFFKVVDILSRTARQNISAYYTRHS